MLFVQVPVSFVLCPVYMQIKSLPVSFSVLPLAFVNVAISMDQSSLAIVTILIIRSFVFRSIMPHLHSVTLPQTSDRPPSQICRAVSQLLRSLFHVPLINIRIVFKSKLSKLRLCLFCGFRRIIRHLANRLGHLSVLQIITTSVDISSAESPFRSMHLYDWVIIHNLVILRGVLLYLCLVLIQR